MKKKASEIKNKLRARKGRVQRRMNRRPIRSIKKKAGIVKKSPTVAMIISCLRT